MFIIILNLFIVALTQSVVIVSCG